ncbi:response regulator [Shewanella sp. SR44-3]|uniref:response regulator n=1 Tax=unclassified Shewanella TaxID=196818 RepID=UPI0015FAD5BE|nr:response regulator [Shewanella sp. SR44-3]MBB1270293.1 diguanylate cyclase [Shewanella sp. SR44-3]
MRVLIVEDSNTVSKILKHLIVQETGCEVDIAEDLTSAIALLEQYKYFVVVADLILPDAPNGEIVKLVRSAYTTPCIVMTGSFNEELRDELLTMGIVDYILKENRYSYQYVAKLVARINSNKDVKVLIAQHSVISRKFVKLLLEQHLFQVIEVEDGEQALTVLAEQEDIRLLITDYEMPNLNGADLVIKLREEFEREDLAIIGLADDASLSARFIKNGANDFLQMPFVHEEFHCRINNTLDALDMMQSLWEKANRDYLTQVFTRRYFFSEYENEHEEEGCFSLALLDIDFFKKVNDTHGHDVGDEVLVTFANRLVEAFGQRFTVARFGGEEFVVAFKGLDADKTLTLMEAFRVKNEHKSISTSAGDLLVTFSCGIATFGDEQIDQVLNRADEALYAAKEQGRNLILVH